MILTDVSSEILNLCRALRNWTWATFERLLMKCEPLSVWNPDGPLIPQWNMTRDQLLDRTHHSGVDLSSDYELLGLLSRDS